MRLAPSTAKSMYWSRALVELALVAALEHLAEARDLAQRLLQVVRGDVGELLELGLDRRSSSVCTSSSRRCASTSSRAVSASAYDVTTDRRMASMSSARPVISGGPSTATRWL